MKWLASSITDLIRRHVELAVERDDASGRSIRVVLQSLPAPVVRAVCSSLADFLAVPGTRIDYHFKIAHQLGRQCRQSIIMGFRPAIFKRHIAAFDKTPII